MNLSFVVNHHKFFLVFSLIIAIFFVSFSPFIKTVNNVDYFNLKNHPDEIFYNEFKKIFGNEEFYVISFEKKDIFTEENLNLIKNISQKLEESKLVRKVLSLANSDNIVGENNYFSVTPFLENIPNTQEGLLKLKTEAINNPLYQGSLISSDGTTTAIVVFTYNHPEDQNYRKNLLLETERILDKYKHGTTFHLAGWTITNYNLSQYMQKDLITFIPVTYLLIAIVTYFFFQNIYLTLLAMITITCCMGSTVGLFTLFGIPLNNVTIIVIPLVMALALSDVVHIFTHMQKPILQKHPDRKKALIVVLNKVTLPCLLTTITTAIGFFSLTISTLEPIRQFAILSSAGMMFEFFFAFFLLPPLILCFNPDSLYFQEKDNQTLTNTLNGITRFISIHYSKILFLSVITIILAGISTTQLKVETNLINFFRPSSQQQQDLKFIEEKLSGVGSLSISIKAKKIDTFKNPDKLRIIENIESYILTLSGVDNIVSFNNFIKEINKSFHNENNSFYRIPENHKLISQYLLLYDSNEINDFITNDYDHTRITVRLSEHNSSANKKIIRKIRNYISSLGSTELDIRVTGQAVQEVNTIDALVSGQIKSLGIAILIISLLMFFCFKSISISLLSLVPNGFPIILNFAIMALLDIPLDTATSLISAVALGIAVDDTIHFLTYYQETRKNGYAIDKAVAETITKKGRALISSSIILCIGFGVLTLSNFMPVFYFGLLSAIIMLTALLGDIFILPSILMCKHRFHSPDFRKLKKTAPTI